MRVAQQPVETTTAAKIQTVKPRKKSLTVLFFIEKGYICKRKDFSFLCGLTNVCHYEKTAHYFKSSTRFFINSYSLFTHSQTINHTHCQAEHHQNSTCPKIIDAWKFYRLQYNIILLERSMFASKSFLTLTSSKGVCHKLPLAGKSFLTLTLYFGGL